MKTNEIAKMLALGTLVFAAVSLPFGNPVIILKLVLAYLFFIYAPFLPMITKMDLGLLERFTLANLVGLSYASVYVILDFIDIPLTRLVFIIITLAVYIGSWWLA